LQICRYRRAACRERDRDITRDQRLQRRRPTGDINKLRLDMVFFEESGFLCKPERAVDKRDRSVSDAQRLGLHRRGVNQKYYREQPLRYSSALQEPDDEREFPHRLFSVCAICKLDCQSCQANEPGIEHLNRQIREEGDRRSPLHLFGRRARN